jgi:hypothetical protein
LNPALSNLKLAEVSAGDVEGVGAIPRLVQKIAYSATALKVSLFLQVALQHHQVHLQHGQGHGIPCGLADTGVPRL